MEKSQLLDELRLEVGKAGDAATNIYSFYSGVIRAFSKKMCPTFGVALYICSTDSIFTSFSSYGTITEKKRYPFGDGIFSICAIRAKLTIDEKDHRMRVYSPFYDGHHLKGILYSECCTLQYEVTEEDYIFIQEVTNYIETKVKQYKKSYK